MKRSYLKRRKGLHSISSNPRQKELRNTQDAVNKMIRERDARPESEGGFGICITCGNYLKLEAGHFRISENESTRFHPYNLNGQCASCNRFAGGMTYEHGKAIDEKYGKGTAEFLEKLSRKEEPWTIEELGTLKAAARMGRRVYEQTYFMLRPNHFPIVERKKKKN
jgi:hypothetical protein